MSRFKSGKQREARPIWQATLRKASILRFVQRFDRLVKWTVVDRLKQTAQLGASAGA